MMFHWQNLNEDRRGRVKGFPWHGRAWLHFGAQRDLTESYDHIRGIEWNLFRPNELRLSATVTLDANADHQIVAGFSFLVASLYLTASLPYGRWLRRHLPEESRRIGAGVDGNNLHVSLWEPDGWDRENPRGGQRTSVLDDFFLGDAKHEETVLEERETLIPMPEKNYPAHVKLVESRWKRPRWFTKKMLRFKVDIPGGIPKPGKGENSWDCGEDATFGLTARGSTVAEAVSSVVECVLRDRERHGGRDWRPATKKPGRRT